MPRPRNIVRLFGGAKRTPPDWHSHASYESFYLAGLKDALWKAGVRPRASSFSKKDFGWAIKEAKKCGWTEQYKDRKLWKEFAPGQMDRALQYELITVPKAALAWLAAERRVSQTKLFKNVDMYRKTRLVPALSYVTDLTFETFHEFRNAVAQDANVILKFKSFDAYLRQETAQRMDAVFQDMIRGKTVTHALADAFLKLIQRHLRSFPGRVDDDGVARRAMIKRLRVQDKASGVKRAIPYAKRISASKAETFREA